MSKIAIIGAGPAGNYSACLLAKKGHKVSVFEERPVIGEPWACTGVITNDVLSRQIRLPEGIIVNRIKKARIISPDGSLVEVNLKNDVIIDRAGFDRHVADMARNAGAEYYVNHRFIGMQENNGSVSFRIKDKNSGKIKSMESDWLVGADGPRSEVAKSAGIYGNRKFYVGLQVTANLENDNAIEFFPSEKGIAWKVPENDKSVRAGIAATERANVYFDEFMKQAAGLDYRERITGHQAGPIPLFNPKVRTQKGKVLLAGDAATMVKAPTLGGINQSLIAATAVADAVETGKDYKKLWKAKLGKDLWLSLMMRKVMNKFSNREYDHLVRIFQKGRNREILERFDRDEPRKFALKLLMREPKLLLISRKLVF